MPESPAPFSWVGGKTLMLRHIIPLMPSHRNYVEVFGGSATLLFAKKPCIGVEVYNDIDSGLVNFFRVLRDPQKYKRLKELLYYTPYAREEFDWAKATIENEGDDIVKAYKWFILARMAFSGYWGGAWARHNDKRGTGTYASFTWRRTIDRLPEFHARIRNVQVDNKDFRDIITFYRAGGTLLYCDPPYMEDTQIVGNVYRYNMTEQDHIDLLNILIEYPEMVILSAYDNDLYDRTLLDAGWVKQEFPVAFRFKLGADRARLSIIWRNPVAVDNLDGDKVKLF